MLTCLLECWNKRCMHHLTSYQRRCCSVSFLWKALSVESEPIEPMFSYLKWRQSECFSEERETEFCNSWKSESLLPTASYHFRSSVWQLCPGGQRKWEMFGYCPRREVLHKYFLLLQWWIAIKCALPRVLRKPSNFAVLVQAVTAPSYYCTVAPETDLASLQKPKLAFCSLTCLKCKLGVTE